MLGAQSVCYSGGVGEELSFEIELLERYGCDVFAFDPTPRSQVFAAKAARERSGLHFLPYGLWSSDGPRRFYAPRDPAHVSHSVDNLQDTDDYFVAECRSVRSVMEELGHERLDLLKLNVEGAEYEVLESALSDGLRIGILVLALHVLNSFGAMVAAVRRLENRAYVPVHVHRHDVTLLDARLLDATIKA